MHVDEGSRLACGALPLWQSHARLSLFAHRLLFVLAHVARHHVLSSQHQLASIIAATCGQFHAVVLQEASDHTPHITDQLIVYTGNTDLAILLNKNTLRFLPSTKPPQAKTPGAWFYSSFVDFCVAPLFPELRRSHFAHFTSTISLPRNVTLPLTFYGDYMGT